jgi:2-polyprenyl-6-methoxyphenol hydroxylase-like FAD-dependent oxidoreductase
VACGPEAEPNSIFPSRPGRAAKLVNAPLSMVTGNEMNAVLIIGAGPVGLTLACELTRYGVPVRIVDKEAARTDKSKALVLWSRSLELLDRGGGAEPFISAGFKAHAVNLTAGNRVIGRITMGDVKSPFPFALMLPQSETERLLEERLGGLGVAVERSVEVTAFSPFADGIDTVLRHPDASEERLRSAWVAGCDGAHSVVRHGVNASFDGETNPSDWMLADVHMSGYPVPDDVASVYWHQDGAFIVFPIVPGRYRLLADLPPSGAEHPPTPTLAQVQAVMDQRGPAGLKAFDPIWLAGFRINGRKVSKYRWGRAFLAGDAAHVHSPAGGQGMNTGMQDAFNLAWKLAMVISGAANGGLLDSYSTERNAVGNEVLKNAGRLTTIGTLKNPLAQAIRNMVGHAVMGLRPVEHAVADQMSEVDIAYHESPLNGAHTAGVTPKPGQRLEPVPGQKPVGSGTVPLFALFADNTAPVQELIRRFNKLVEPQVRPAQQQNAILLVRPDGYVACATRDPGAVAAYLQQIALS